MLEPTHSMNWRDTVKGVTILSLLPWMEYSKDTPNLLDYIHLKNLIKDYVFTSYLQLIILKYI